MGRRTRAEMARQAYETGQETLRESEARRALTEERLGIEESLLGTREQVEGRLGASQAVLPYTQRYGFDETMVDELAAGRFARYGVQYLAPSVDPFKYFSGTPIDAAAYHNIGYAKPLEGPAGGLRGYVADLTTQANSLLEQAQKAAEEGNLDLASQLRTQAQDVFANLDPKLASGINLRENPEYAARAQLGSPMARTVGGLVQQGREFLDTESQTSQRFIRSMTEPAMRAIDAQGRSMQRSVRDLALAAGAARRPGAEAAGAARAGEELAAQKSQVLGETMKYFETFSREFAANTAGFAQSWLQNQSGIRDSFQSSIDQLRLQMSTASLARGAQLTEQAFQMEQADIEWRRQLVAAIAGATISGGSSALTAGILA